VTDAMNMRGVTASNPPGIVDRDAILAGNDLLELTEDVPRAIAEIKKAIKDKKIDQKEIDARCRKILAMKYALGLNKPQNVALKNITTDLNQSHAKLLNRDLIEASITVLKNQNNVLPILDLDKIHVASVSFGKSQVTTFQRTLSLYTRIDHFVLPADAPQKVIDSVSNLLTKYNQIIIGIHDEPGRPLNRITLSPSVLAFVTSLAAKDNTIVAAFKNPYVLNSINGIEEADGLLVTYQDNADTEDLAAQLIFGGIGTSGKLPVSIGNKFPAGHGIDINGGIRFKYTLPEDAGMDSKVLYNGVDSLVNQAFGVRAIPGCQVFVAKDMKVVMYKAYGYQDYADTIKVKRTDLYDLASVTKISTGLPSLMKLYDDGKFKLDATLGDYLPKFKKSNKKDIPMYDILTHQAQFKPWIPFWKNTLNKKGLYRWSTIRNDSSKRFSIKLKDGMYLNNKYPDRIVKDIMKSPLEAEKKYVYSDFFFILAPGVVRSMIDVDFPTYIQNNFYTPLGATSVTYNPAKKYPKKSIVPTEHDYYFRHQPIHGTVHDEGAIMMGGVSGHAGLFANANDLAKLMQMYLNMGEYGGRRYIKEETLKEWTKTRFPENNNRRALGFDKPNLKYAGENNNTAKDASVDSFGHTGFTGTIVWMDPQTKLLYIFLSNRVNPTRDNSRLYSLNTRTKIQQVLYNSMRK
jgi:CubicO group peptidase (beta-lactamase class C family)